MGNGDLKIQALISPRTIRMWRVGQTLFWLVGIFILFSLLFYPAIGLNLFWNVLITIAPALLVVSTGAWRNLCPLASTALFPRHMGFAQRKKLTSRQIGKLNLVAVTALFVIVPLRHAIFDMNGLATALLIISLGAIAVVVSLRYEWKSAWCSGLCPVYPVEKLYGLRSRALLVNAHCDRCYRCVTPCADVTPGIHPRSVKKTTYDRLTGLIMVGAFPGFVWGWFQVPSSPGVTKVGQLIAIFIPPTIGLIVTATLFLILQRFLPERRLIGIFSAAAVSCYYWFRLPALFGFGIFPGAGMLLDLTGILPEWPIKIAVFALTLFFFWWIVFSKQKKTSWVLRPVYANKENESERKSPR